jgi:hypothetical protein
MKLTEIPEAREVSREAPGRSLAGGSVEYDVNCNSTLFKIAEGRRAGRYAVVQENQIYYFDLPEGTEEIFPEWEVKTSKTVCEDFETGLCIRKGENSNDLFLKIKFAPILARYNLPQQPMTVLAYSDYTPRLGTQSGYRALQFTLFPDRKGWNYAYIAKTGSIFSWENFRKYGQTSLHPGDEINCYGR